MLRSGDEEKDNEGNSATATMSARAGTSNTSTVGRSEFSCLTNTTSSSRSHGSISTASETPAAIREDKPVYLEKELSMAVGVLTSHACSEEGLEDATSLLLQLSKSSSTLRLLVIRLLLEGKEELICFFVRCSLDKLKDETNFAGFDSTHRSIEKRIFVLLAFTFAFLFFSIYSNMKNFVFLPMIYRYVAYY